MQSFVERMITVLAQGSVEFIIAGNISAVLQGAPVVTQDLDVCYRRSNENLEKLARALAPFKPRLRGLPPGLPDVFDDRTLLLGTNFTLAIEDEFLDLLGEMSAVGGYEEVVGRAEELEVAGHRVKVLALVDLIASKRAAGRPKDLAVLPLLEATLKLKEEQ
jgi:hypothetical protein